MVIWHLSYGKGPLRTAKEETSYYHMGYSFQIAGHVLLYVLSHRQDSKYYSLCYTGRGALDGTRNG